MSTDGITGSTILLVDDHQGLRSTLRKLLLKCGYSVIEASNGQEAIEITVALSPDLIIMDLQMPIMDGISATRQIRQLVGGSRETPILAISAAGSEMKETALQAGCNDYLSKSEIALLVTTIEQIIKN